MDNWNPMEDDFRNVTFNTYNEGQGANLEPHFQPAYVYNAELQKKKYNPSGVKLYVHPVPTNIDKERLENIFSGFGDVNSAWIHPEKRFAFVFMKDVTGAQKSIRELNDSKDYEFKVSIANEKEKPKPFVTDVPAVNDYYGKIRTYKYEMNERKRYADSDDEEDDDSEVEEERWRVRKYFENFDHRMAHIADKSTASRHATNSTRSIDPIQRGQLSTLITRQPVVAAASPYSSMMAPQVSRSCMYCHHATTDRCLRCNQPFCSVDCNIHGYQYHTQTCIRDSGHSSQNQHPNPYNPLVTGNGMYAGSNIELETFRNEANDYCSSTASFRAARNQPPKMITGAVDQAAVLVPYRTTSTARNSVERGSDVEETRRTVSGGRETERDGRQSQRRTHNDDGAYENRLANGDEPRSSQRDGRNYQDGNGRASRSNNKSYRSERDPSMEIPAYLARENRKKFEIGKPTEVRINSINPVTVTFSEEIELLSRMMKELQDMEHNERITTLLEQNRCVAPRKNVWYRAVIATVEPLTIRFIDMSVDTYPAQLEDLRKLPTKFAGVSKFCHRAVFANATPDELNEFKRSNRSVTVIPMESGLPSAARLRLQKNESEELDGDVRETLRTRKNESEDYISDVREKLFEKASEREARNARRTNDDAREKSFERAPEREARNARRTSGDEREKSFEMGAEQETKNARKSRGANSDRSSVASSNSSEPLPDLTFTLMADVRTEVSVTFVESADTFYVTDREKMETLEGHIRKAVPDRFPDVDALKISRGNVFAAWFDNGWYRAEVTSTEPLEIYYVDFGNKRSDKGIHLKKLPRRFVDVPHLAVRVRLKDGHVKEFNIRENQSTVIEPINKSQNRLHGEEWIVRVVTAGAAATSTSRATTLQRTSSMDTLANESRRAPSFESSENRRRDSSSNMTPDNRRNGSATSTPDNRRGGSSNPTPDYRRNGSSNLTLDNCKNDGSSFTPDNCKNDGSSLTPDNRRNGITSSTSSSRRNSNSSSTPDNRRNVLQNAVSPAGKARIRKVMIQWQKPDSDKDYWVMDVHKKEFLERIVDVPEAEYTKRPVKEARLGMRCACSYEGMWCRAQIVKVLPSLEISYIDFGNTEAANLKDLFHEPQQISDIEPLAEHVKFADDVKLEASQECLIRKKSGSDNVWELVSEEELQQQQQPPPRAETTNRHLDVYELENHTIQVRVVYEIEEGFEYGVVPTQHLESFRQVQLTLRNRASALPRLTEWDVEDRCVIVDDENTSFRGIILEAAPLIVQFMDFGHDGEEINPKQLHRMDDDLAEIPPLAFRVCLDAQVGAFKVGKIYTVRLLQPVGQVSYAAEIVASDKRTAAPVNEPTLSNDDSSYSPTPSYRDNEGSPPTPSYRDNEGSPPTPSYRDNEGSPPPPYRDREASPPPSDRDNGSSPIPPFCDNGQSVIASALDKMHEYGLNRICPSLPSFGHVLDALPASVSGKIYFVERLSETLYTGMLIQIHAQIATDMEKLQTTSEESYRPVIGEVVKVFAEELEFWVRGLVVDMPNGIGSGYLVALMDFAFVGEFGKIAKLDDEFTKCVLHSIYIEFETIPKFPPVLKEYYDYSRYHNSCDEYSRVMTDTAGVTVAVAITSQTPRGEVGEEVRAAVRPWELCIDTLPPRSRTFKTDNEVKISSLIASNKCAIVMGDARSSEHRIEFSDALTLYYEDNTTDGTPAKLLSGEIHAVEHDSRYYRAEILEKQGQESYAVRLLDRGDTIVVNKDSVRELPEKFKRPYSFATVVTLKGVRFTEINKKARKLMDFLIMEEKKFELVIDDGSEVRLRFLPSEDYDEINDNNKTLNNHLNDLLTPRWKQFSDYFRKHEVVVDAEDRERMSVESDLFFERYEEGAVMKLRVMAVQVEHREISVVNERGRFYRRMSEVNLAGQMEEYATEVTGSYVPSQSELCIVKHDNRWHRAICIDASFDKKITLSLIDLTKVIQAKHVNIRSMPKDFVRSYPCVSLLCKVIDCDLEDYQFKNLEGEEIDCRIVQRFGDDYYEIKIENNSLACNGVAN